MVIKGDLFKLIVEELKKINPDNIQDIYKFDLVLDNDSICINVYNKAGSFVNRLLYKEIVEDDKSGNVLDVKCTTNEVGVKNIMGINEYLDNKLCASTDEDNRIYIVEVIDNLENTGNAFTSKVIPFKNKDLATIEFRKQVRIANPSINEDAIEEYVEDKEYSLNCGEWVIVRLHKVKVQ